MFIQGVEAYLKRICQINKNSIIYPHVPKTKGSRPNGIGPFEEAVILLLLSPERAICHLRSGKVEINEVPMQRSGHENS